MQNLKGKVAFITGGASGIGFGMAEALAKQGMQIMLADIEADGLTTAVAKLIAKGIDADGFLTDVAQRQSLIDAAAKTVERFGRVDVLCNNAGVTANGAMGAISPGDWDWVIDVNLMGVIYGTESFLPYLKAHGEGGHIVNTASIAGMLAAPTAEPYCATKFAVVGMSESWASELAPHNIGVSVLCPGFVQSRINDSKRTRGVQYGETGQPTEGLSVNVSHDQLSSGTPAAIVGERVVEGILANELFIFPHTEFQPLVKARYEAILASFDQVARSKILPQNPGPTLPASIVQELTQHAATLA